MELSRREKAILAQIEDEFTPKETAIAQALNAGPACRLQHSPTVRTWLGLLGLLAPRTHHDPLGILLDRLFEYLADVGNLPRYFDRMTSAEPADGDAVTVTAQVHRETERGEAWFRVDGTARRIQWAPKATATTPAPSTSAPNRDRTIVEIELHTEHTATDEIDQSLDITLDQFVGGIAAK